MVNPKQVPKDNLYGQSGWYTYYAGFADTFVEDILKKQSQEIKIVDPWNGAGTTTFCAFAAGMESYGFDINPAMVVIAKAKNFNPKNINLIELQECLLKARGGKKIY